MRLKDKVISSGARTMKRKKTFCFINYAKVFNKIQFIILSFIKKVINWSKYLLAVIGRFVHYITLGMDN